MRLVITGGAVCGDASLLTTRGTSFSPAISVENSLDLIWKKALHDNIFDTFLFPSTFMVHAHVTPRACRGSLTWQAAGRAPAECHSYTMAILKITVGRRRASWQELT